MSLGISFDTGELFPGWLPNIFFGSRQFFPDFFLGIFCGPREVFTDSFLGIFFFPPSRFLVVLSDITNCTLYVFSGSFHDIVSAGSRFLPGVFHNTLFFLSSGVLVNDGLHHAVKFLDVFSMVGYWAF